jgi:putative tricarboxylic transport membrane protein
VGETFFPSGEKMARDKWSSLVWLGLATWVCLASYKLSLGSFHNPGPGFLSFIAGLIVGALALVVHLQSRSSSSPAKPAVPFWANTDRSLRMMVTVVALLIYAIGMEYLGFLLSTFIFLAFLLKFIEPQRWTVVIFGSLLASAASYIIFEIWLQSQLPRGPFEIF